MSVNQCQLWQKNLNGQKTFKINEYNWLEFWETKMYCSMCINASSLPNWTCEMRKMQFIFFVPPNEELEGTLHPQK
jgi:hypothetical protein